MILLRFIYLWATILEITFCLSPSTLLSLANLQHQKAKALATALTWKLKNRYNKLPKSIHGNRFIRDTRYEYTPHAYYVHNLVPQSYDYKNLDINRPQYLKPQSHSYTPHWKGLFPYQLKYKSAQPDEYSKDFIVGEPYNEDFVLSSDIKDEKFDDEDVLGTFNILPLSYEKYEEPLYQNPDEFDPKQPEDRNKVVDFIKSTAKTTEMILHMLNPINYHLNDPVNEDTNYPTEGYNHDKEDVEPYMNYKPANLPHIFKVDKNLEDYLETQQKSLKKLEDDFKRHIYSEINEKSEYKDEKLEDYLKNHQKILEKFQEDLKKKLTPKNEKHQYDLLPTVYPIYTVHDSYTEILPPTPIKQDVLPTVHKLYTNNEGFGELYKNEQQKYENDVHETLKPYNLNQSIPEPTKPNILPRDYPESQYIMDSNTPNEGVISPYSKDPNFPYTIRNLYDDINKKNIPTPEEDFETPGPIPTNNLFDQIDESVQNLEHLVYNDQQQDKSSPQMVSDELKQLREAVTNNSYSDLKAQKEINLLKQTEKIRNFIENHDEVLGDVYQPSKEQYFFQKSPVDGTVQRSMISNEANPIVSYIFKLPFNNEFDRRSVRHVKNGTETYINDMKNILSFLQDIVSHDEHLLIMNYLENVIVDNIQEGEEKQEANHTRIKRHVPIKTLLLDPRVNVDVPKFMDNIGTFTKTLFDHKDTPLYHVRNFVGSMKDAALATMKIPNQNIIVPTEYNIVDNPNKEETILGNSYPNLSSRFGNEDEEIPNWPQELVQNTFQNVGQVVRNVVKSGQEAVQHVGEMTNHAKKVIMTSKQAPDILLQTVTPIPLATDKKKFMLNSRFGGDTVLAQPEQQPQVEFIKMGHLLDAVGVSNPDIQSKSFSPRTNFRHVEYAKKLRENLEKIVPNSNIAKDISPSTNKVVDTMKNFRNDIEKLTKKNVFQKTNDSEENVGISINNILSQSDDEMKKISNDLPLVNKKITKEEYIQNVKNKLEDFISTSNTIKNSIYPRARKEDHMENIKNRIDNIIPKSIKSLSAKNDKGKNNQLQKAWKDFQDMINTVNPVNNVQKIVQPLGKYIKNGRSSLISDKNNKILDNLHDYISQTKNKLTDLNERTPLGITKMKCSKRNKREVAESEETWDANKNEELLGSSFISPRLTLPYLIPSLVQPNQLFGRAAVENQLLPDLKIDKQNVLQNLNQLIPVSAPKILASSLDIQHLIGSILGAPHILGQPQNNGIGALSKEELEYNDDTNSEENVATSLKMIPALTTPFMGKISDKDKNKFYEQYEPPKKYYLVDNPQLFEKYEPSFICSCQKNDDYLYDNDSI
ncbi:uncharacterized protein LOC130445776 [Diorhabda sublineata]|uniref:uncharacterized protein LOC130445776 n=1 Tax=Diorhabda sublineata TaxID=1163346 RepID=UPI0024E154C9|nr:uncharacterized protein LOC130445776 [Diorhabda sublineata]